MHYLRYELSYIYGVYWYRCQYKQGYMQIIKTFYTLTFQHKAMRHILSLWRMNEGETHFCHCSPTKHDLTFLVP